MPWTEQYVEKLLKPVFPQNLPPDTSINPSTPHFAFLAHESDYLEIDS